MGEAIASGIRSLLASEKALAAGFLVACATVLVALSKMTVDQWVSYTEVIFGGYIIGKTAQGSVAALAASKRPDVSTSQTVTVETKETKTDA